MSYLVNTNVLLRLVQKTSSLHAIARKAVLTLRRQGEELYVIPQNLIEFWAVATQHSFQIRNRRGPSPPSANATPK